MTDPRPSAFTELMNSASRRLSKLPTNDKDLKEYIEGLIKSGSARVSYLPMDSTTSIWKHFQLVQLDGGSIEVDGPQNVKLVKEFIQCKVNPNICKCMSIFVNI
jgi:hypothetical protein